MDPSVPDPATTSPFDASAEAYDAEFTAASIGRWQRRVVWDGLEESLRGCESVLEVGCGTGEDAVFMARLGCSVIATDLSSSMIAVAHEKAKSAGLQARISTRVASLPLLESLRQHDLPVVGDHLGSADSGRVDGLGDRLRVDRVFSDFGVVNCLSPGELERFFQESHLRLRPGGRLLLVVMPQGCWWESLYFVLRGRWREVLRRRRSPQRARLRSSGSAVTEELDVWYYSASALAALAPDFVVCSVAPVGFLVPPSLLQRWFGQAPGAWLGSLLAWGDRKLAYVARRARGPLGRSWARLLARHSDHYWVELEPRSVAAEAPAEAAVEEASHRSR